MKTLQPYALHGDDNGDYLYTYTPGTHTVSATPYDKLMEKARRGSSELSTLR
ncbi:MAG: hypothetical protein R3B93_07300 [Bacteroidia bacterium]